MVPWLVSPGSKDTSRKFRHAKYIGIQNALSKVYKFHQSCVHPFLRHLARYISLFVKLCSTDEIFKFLSHLWTCPCQVKCIISEEKESWILWISDRDHVVIVRVYKISSTKRKVTSKLTCMNSYSISNHAKKDILKSKGSSVLNYSDEAATLESIYSEDFVTHIEPSWSSTTYVIIVATERLVQRYNHPHKSSPHTPLISKGADPSPYRGVNVMSEDLVNRVSVLAVRDFKDTVAAKACDMPSGDVAYGEPQSLEVQSICVPQQIKCSVPFSVLRSASAIASTITSSITISITPNTALGLLQTEASPLEKTSIQPQINISATQCFSMNDANAHILGIRNIQHVFKCDCFSKLNGSCISWSSTPITCSAVPTSSAQPVCGIPAASCACVEVDDALVRGHKKLPQRQESQKKEYERACEEKDPSLSSTGMVYTTLNIVSEFKDDLAEIITGRGCYAKSLSQVCEAANPSPSSAGMVYTTLNIVSEFKDDVAEIVTDRECYAKSLVQINSKCPVPQNITDSKATTIAQLTHFTRNVPATTAPMALISTPHVPLCIQIPSSTETIDIFLCKQSKDIFTSATECLCSEDYGHMIPQLEQITQHTCATPHCLALMVTHFGLGLAYYKMADHHQATKYFTEYRSLAQTLARPADISLAHIYLGDISTIKSDHSSAAYHYLEAIQHYGTQNSSTLFKLAMPSVSDLYAKQGTALKQTSQMLKAVEAFRNAIHHAPDRKSKLSIHNSLGNLLQSMGDYTGALEEYKKAAKLGEELHDLISLGWAHGNMGNAYLGLHQKDTALHHLKKALDLAIEHESTPQAISRAYNNLGTAYQSLEDLKQAEENFKLALNQAIYGNDAAGQARARGNLGNLLMLGKSYERAVEQYSEVFNLSKDRQVLSTAYHNRGCAYWEWAEQVRSAQNGTTSGTSGRDNPQVLGNTGSMVSRPGFASTELYRLGANDLTQAIELCNEVLQSTKGSMQGLSLSVSVIESSSRTFHKLQDCLIGLQQMDEALVIAEQCRARTLGERLLEKIGGLSHLTPPLSLDQIQYIVKSQEQPVVYLSYTGSKLIVWLIAPIYGHVHIHCRVVEVDKLEKEKFGGKTFDQYVRQSVQETVVGNDLELFQEFSSTQTSPLTVLFDVVVLPILDMLGKCKLQNLKNLILIPDSYTSLIPFVALHSQKDFNKTFGSTFSLQMMPSLLIMGILNEAHPTSAVMYDSRTACVVGNPHIPIFEHNKEEWSLGRLPHATEEAKWISRLLKVQPLLHEQATKVAIVTKLSSAQVIHIATHGSAVSGFLAFAGPDSSNGKPSKSEDILLLPSEVEQMNLRAALVVLSSCDSGRGMVRADGIIGMGRAFLLAGAQSVLTTLWRIPDESAGMFMQFFYQYLEDGLGTTHALQKASLSVRCFRKYSQYTHWGGFQLIGRETYLNRTKTTEEALLTASLGPRCVFPQGAILEKLEQGLIQSTSQPSSVQILCGYEGTEPSGHVSYFIHSNHDHFRGGVFWISCTSEEVMAACVKRSMEVIHKIELKTNDPVLVVLDNIGPQSLTSFSNGKEIEMTTFHKLLCHPSSHIAATLTAANGTDLSSIVDQIHILLIRGSNVIEVEPFSPIHTTQRIVYGHLQKTKCPSPSDEDRDALEVLADFTNGSPCVIDIMTSRGMSTKYPESLGAFARRLVFSNVVDKQPMEAMCDVGFDLWGAINRLEDLCELTSYEELFFHCLSIFHSVPVPKCVLEGLSRLIKHVSSQATSCEEMCQKLVDFNLLRSYPHPVVICPIGSDNMEGKETSLCYSVASAVAMAIWNGQMDDTDKVMALGIWYRVFENIYFNRHILSSSELQYVFGLVCVVVEVCDCICYLIGEECYQLFYLMLARFKTNLLSL